MSRKHKEAVYAYVYDLSEQNEHAFRFGLGAYHSGIVCHGSEYTFGQQGCFSHRPGGAEDTPGVKFRTKVELGKTDKSHKEVQTIFSNLKPYFQGDDYSTVSKNCNHFADEFSKRIFDSKKSVMPSWINRTANFGNKVSKLFGGKKKDENELPPPEKRFKAFTGGGQTLSGKKVEEQVEKKSSWKLWGGKKKEKKEEKPQNVSSQEQQRMDRAKILEATMKRLEQK